MPTLRERVRPVGAWASAAVALAARPSLWPTAAVQAVRVTPAQWWRRAPFLPVPDRRYIRYRLETQYGKIADVEPHDVITYLEWCRDMAARRRSA
ncbi:MAG TPA: hypothetical protein VF441_10240 [Acidimicrobiia bacterium]